MDESRNPPVNLRHVGIVALSLAAIALHFALRFGVHAAERASQLPLMVALVAGGIPLVLDIVTKLLRREWGADLIAGLSVMTALLLKEYLAGAIIVLMLSGGAALESYAVRNASSVLRALAKRMPSIAHRKRDGQLTDVALNAITVGDALSVFPHEVCPVDGVVMEGHGVMDESFLTGEPFRMSKAPGSTVISGAVNGDSALTITATKPAADSRYAKIMEVMRASERYQPKLRRLGDRLGTFYAPLALGVAVLAWWLSGDSQRFLAVLVIATPCPLLIAIPVAILGAISLCARHAIIVKKPVALEHIASCETAIFDKTGTLTYGTPVLSEIFCAPGVERHAVLSLVASLERYSKHPLAGAVLNAAQQERLVLHEVAHLSERPGEGLRGTVAGHEVQITSRTVLTARPLAGVSLPPVAGGLECVVLLDGAYAATFRFRDEPRTEGRSFIAHLGPKHRLHRILLVSGDRASEVRYLAERVGITEVFAEQSPEQKLAIVRRETQTAETLFVGDGINDAPALMASTVGVAIGPHSDITSQAAGVVVMDSSLTKVDEFMHISAHMRAIAVQSALGGMALSLIGMLIASTGRLPPVMGAMTQEVIDVLAIANALRAALPPKELSDF